MDNPNHLRDLLQLENRYFVLRHGEAKQNVQGILISDPNKGIDKFGLTLRGRRQVKKSLLENDILDTDTLIFASDFKRTRETAGIAKKILKVSNVYYRSELRERFMGEWEGKEEAKAAPKLWEGDAKNPDNKKRDVESPNEVLRRTTAFVRDLEKKQRGKKILLISHADPIHILQAGFMKIDSSRHREVPPIGNGEIRELILENLK